MNAQNPWTFPGPNRGRRLSNRGSQRPRTHSRAPLAAPRGSPGAPVLGRCQQHLSWFPHSGPSGMSQISPPSCVHSVSRTRTQGLVGGEPRTSWSWTLTAVRGVVGGGASPRCCPSKRRGTLASWSLQSLTASCVLTSSSVSDVRSGPNQH